MCIGWVMGKDPGVWVCIYFVDGWGGEVVCLGMHDLYELFLLCDNLVMGVLSSVFQ